MFAMWTNDLDLSEAASSCIHGTFSFAWITTTSGMFFFCWHNLYKYINKWQTTQCCYDHLWWVNGPVATGFSFLQWSYQCGPYWSWLWQTSCCSQQSVLSGDSASLKRGCSCVSCFSACLHTWRQLWNVTVTPLTLRATYHSRISSYTV